jgi:hypothetical protein
LSKAFEFTTVQLGRYFVWNTGPPYFK